MEPAPTGYYHGGFPHLLSGMFVLPRSKTGAKRNSVDFGEYETRADRVYITKDIYAAASFALKYPKCLGAVYEVEPVGELHPDDDGLIPGRPPQHFHCATARVVRVVNIPPDMYRETLRRWERHVETSGAAGAIHGA
jgi:hypothetical protein